MLVLDEPTNDLDVETLELLEELLVEYAGTVILVSHDRAFMDNVVSSILVFEGKGEVQEYVGGYSDWKKRNDSQKTSSNGKREAAKQADNHEDRKKQKASNQKRLKELDKLTTKIEQAETELAEINQKMGEADFFKQSTEQQTTVYNKASTLEADIVRFMEAWELLEAN